MTSIIITISTAKSMTEAELFEYIMSTIESDWSYDNSEYEIVIESEE